MSIRVSLCIAVLIACRPLPAQEDPESRPAGKGRPPLRGMLVPAEAEELAFWPRAYKGSIVVTSVRPHGSRVLEGETVLEVDLEPLEEQVRDAAHALEDARHALELAELEATLATAKAETGLKHAQHDLKLAQQRLQAWKEHERVFSRESGRLSMESTRHRIEDQEEELAQLQKMYAEDELVDATEEIVLHRAKRNLAHMRRRAELSERRREYREGLDAQLDLEQKELQLAAKRLSLETRRMDMRKAEMQREARLRSARRTVEKAQQRLDELKHDLEALRFRAPRSGILLHGDEGVVAGGAELERGASITPRKTVLRVAAPDALQVELELPESRLLAAREGPEVMVRLTADPDVMLVGTLRVDPLPVGEAGKKGARYRARVELEGGHPALRAGMTCSILPAPQEER